MKMRSIGKVVALRKAGFEKKKKRSSLLSLLAASLPGQENSVDVGQDTSLGDGDSREKLVQLLVVADGQLKVAWVDPLLLVVPSSVAGQLQDLSSEVLHDSSQIDWSASTNTLGVVASLEKTVDTAHRELESCTGRAGLGLSTSFASFSTSRHDEGFLV